MRFKLLFLLLLFWPVEIWSQAVPSRFKNQYIETNSEINTVIRGADPTGVLDSRTAIKNAISAASPDGGIIYLPAGKYRIKDSIEILNRRGLIFRGAGGIGMAGTAGTVIFPDSINNKPVFKLINCTNISFEDISFKGSSDSNYIPSALIESNYDPGKPMTYRVTGNRFSRCTFGEVTIPLVGGGHLKGQKKGIKYTAVGGGGNNDLGTFQDLYFYHFSEACISFEHESVKGNLITNCNFNFSRRGIATNLGPNGEGGSFNVFGGTSGGCYEALFDLGQMNDAIIISGMNCENDYIWLRTGGPSGVSWPISIIGNRWAGDNGS